ncbi:MAG: hypothetical protein ACAI43_14300 [Phycisphaerae bacterium]
MEPRPKTSVWVYVLLVAVVAGLGVFIVLRIRDNAADRKAIDGTLDDLKRRETGGK